MPKREVAARGAPAGTEAQNIAPARGSRLTGALGWLRELGLDLLALVWPSLCVGCGRQDRELCSTCAVEVADAPPDEVHAIPALGVPGFAAGAYDGILRAVLLAYKHRGAYSFGRMLGPRLAVPLRAALAAEHHRQRALDRGAGDALPRAPVWVPLPSRKRRERERGYRHVDVMLRAGLLSGRLPGERLRLLVPRRGRVGQVGLDSAARERNARLIRVRRDAERRLNGRGVILVDDIATTGATLWAAIAVFEAEGIPVVGAVTLCSAERRDAPQKTEWNLTGERG
ncbi:ComF family protein [Leucobacter sp. NPDC015123]|uniref:ComF family protein n=1 Tax=Leucobacter sp. NPDC015123 TaxID=3364129 RepID=UPI0036F475E3